MPTTVVTKPKVDIAEKLLADMQSQVHESGQVVLHILYAVPPGFHSSYIRIWPTSFLIDKGSSHRSELVHAENITYYPDWYECLPGHTCFFTLIFSGLPRTCTAFDFIEECTNQSGAFAVYDIVRNESDVYYLRMT